VDTTAYDQGHIPGAVAWNWQTQLQDGIRRDLIDKPTLERLPAPPAFPTTHHPSLWRQQQLFAAYALWQLEAHGHKDVRLINRWPQKWLGKSDRSQRIPPKSPRVLSGFGR